jgi:hypothetical protein
MTDTLSQGKPVFQTFLMALNNITPSQSGQITKNDQLPLRCTG